MISEEQIMNALRNVIDPEIGLNIVDLGLIYNLVIDESSIKVEMTLTTPGCPMHSSMTAAAENVLKQLAPQSAVDIKLVWEPRWTPDMMSDEARRNL
jgi:metal-sulfur cluster biosynthetic enzyme